MMRKSLFVASLFLITSLSGCGGGRQTVIVSDTPNMVTSKEVDENMLIFNAAAKIVQKKFLQVPQAVKFYLQLTRFWF